MKRDVSLDPDLIFSSAHVYGMVNYLVMYEGVKIDGKANNLYVYEAQEDGNKSLARLLNELTKRLFGADFHLPDYAQAILLGGMCDTMDLSNGLLEPDVFQHWFTTDYETMAGWNERYDEEAKDFLDALHAIYLTETEYKAFVGETPLNMAHFPHWANVGAAAILHVKQKMRILNERKDDYATAYMHVLSHEGTKLILSFAVLVDLWVWRLRQDAFETTKESGTE